MKRILNVLALCLWTASLVVAIIGGSWPVIIPTLMCVFYSGWDVFRDE